MLLQMHRDCLLPNREGTRSQELISPSPIYNVSNVLTNKQVCGFDIDGKVYWLGGCEPKPEVV
jgi:hypothetical protein